MCGTIEINTQDNQSIMKRRQFLLYSAAGIASLGAGGGLWLSHSDGQPLTIESALGKLAALQGRVVISTGEWSAFQVFRHLAQSIQYSMDGFPEHKPEWFQNTVGQWAFSAFAMKGAMHHDLSEPIPGEPRWEVEGDVQSALLHLDTTLRMFAVYEGPLQPHFAYGTLAKQDYIAAHVMHLNNHLSQIQV